MFTSLFVCVWSGYMQGSLEVHWADVALSMETAYSLLLGNTVPLHQYHVFAHLCRFGYVVRRHSNRYVSTHRCRSLHFPNCCSNRSAFQLCALSRSLAPTCSHVRWDFFAALEQLPFSSFLQKKLYIANVL